MMRVGILMYDGCQILDAVGPATVFEVASLYGAPYSVTFASPQGGPVVCSVGATIQTLPVRSVRDFDTLLVAGAADPRVSTRQASLAALTRRAVRAGCRVGSVCTGAFVLAQAGLLDGRRATTHWATVALLRRLSPTTDVDPESIFMEDRGIWTSAGVTAGIDMALAMVARDHGEELARKVAQMMVVYYRRPGTQSQHSTLLGMVTPDNRFASLLVWAREHITDRLSTEDLAAQAALSVRQFTRAFTRAMGFPPAKAIERLRVESARASIEAGARSLEEVARSAGFGNVERMRRAFVKITGQPPMALRRLSAS
jgi:transcriptional regulator GlxA family with amidase domain